MGVDAGHDPREGATIVAITVRMECSGRGRWEVAAPDRDRIMCETLDDARRAAYVSAARTAACELIVHDAYHRVLSRELVNCNPGAPSIDQNAETSPGSSARADTNRLE